MSDNLYDQVNILNFNTFTYPGRFLSGLRNDLELIARNHFLTLTKSLTL